MKGAFGRVPEEGLFPVSYPEYVLLELEGEKNTLNPPLNPARIR